MCLLDPKLTKKGVFVRKKSGSILISQNPKINITRSRFNSYNWNWRSLVQRSTPVKQLNSDENEKDNQGVIPIRENRVILGPKVTFCSLKSGSTL